MSTNEVKNKIRAKECPDCKIAIDFTTEPNPRIVLCPLHASAKQVTQERDALWARLNWLINELNELHSNVMRDVFGNAHDDEGDITVEWIDQQIAAKERAK